MAAYDVEPWSELFVATAGAGAALAGLVFVAVSINIDRILKLPGVPERGVGTVGALIVVVVVSLVGLVPGQSNVAVGIELLVVAIAFAFTNARLWPRVRPERGSPLSWTVSRIAVHAIVIVPLAVGAFGLIAEAGGGLYWIAAALVGAIVGAVTTAWVLMVEILR